MPTEAGNLALPDPDFVKNLEGGLKTMNAEARFNAYLAAEKLPVLSSPCPDV